MTFSAAATSASDPLEHLLVAQKTEAALLIDAGGTIAAASDLARALLGLDEIDTSSLSDVEHENELTALVDQARSSGEVCVADVTLMTRGAFTVNASPVGADAAYVVIRLVPMAHINRPRRHDTDSNELLRWKHHEPLRDIVLAHLGHEFRTPLNAVIGYADALRSQSSFAEDPERVRDYAGIIAGAARHMLSVSDHLLDAARLDRGSFDLKPEPCNLTALVVSAVRVCEAARTGSTDTRLRLALDNKPVTLRADESALRQVVINLVDNAMKFTPPTGTITIQTGTIQTGTEQAGAPSLRSTTPDVASPLRRRKGCSGRSARPGTNGKPVTGAGQDWVSASASRSWSCTAGRSR